MITGSIAECVAKYVESQYLAGCIEALERYCRIYALVTPRYVIEHDDRVIRHTLARILCAKIYDKARHFPNWGDEETMRCLDNFWAYGDIEKPTRE